MKLEELKANKVGTCPLCGSHEVDYDSPEIDDNVMWYPCNCPNCNATWNEVYNLSFSQVDNVCDETGNELYNSLDEIYHSLKGDN